MELRAAPVPYAFAQEITLFQREAADVNSGKSSWTVTPHWRKGTLALAALWGRAVRKEFVLTTAEFGDANHPHSAAAWGKVWRALVASGPISRVSQEPVYIVSDRQVRLLSRKKLLFELLETLNGHSPNPHHD
jgi:hypothetical protein